MIRRIIALIVLLTPALALAQTAAGVTSKEVRFYSEGVQCYGKLFLPAGFSPSSKAAAVILAPVPGETAASIEKHGTALAAQGLAALTIDYRGWGKSGGFLTLAEPVRWDDRLRFSQHTAKVRITRRRLVPEHQILDIRNAISFIQGEPGIDRARIGVWGAGLAGGHAMVVAATDSRIKAVVAQAAVIPGKDIPRRAFAPSAEQQAAMVQQARTGTTETEAKLALVQYYPFHYVDAIPKTVAVLQVTTAQDTSAAADWFVKHLGTP
jgi:cephalosporin-C deacetylase-like acetyl esterase